MSVPITPIDLGDVVRLKKPHPCGTNEWEIVRLGADIGLRCHGCDRKVMLVRSEFDRRFRGYLSRVATPVDKPADKPVDKPAGAPADKPARTSAEPDQPAAPRHPATPAQEPTAER